MAVELSSLQMRTNQAKIWCVAAALAAACPLVAAAQTTAPATGPAAAAVPSVITDDDISKVISHGVNYLWHVQRSDGRWATPYDSQFEGGGTALVVLTLLSAGEKPDGDKMKSAIGYLASLDPPTVYARSFRTMVYARLGSHYEDKLKDDVKFLVARQGTSGGWGYGVGHETTELMPDWTDASNTQLAVLALRDASEAGADVPPGVWRKCRTYWATSQRKDGGWGYQAPSEAPACGTAATFP